MKTNSFFVGGVRNGEDRPEAVMLRIDRLVIEEARDIAKLLGLKEIKVDAWTKEDTAMMNTSIPVGQGVWVVSSHMLGVN